MTKAPAFQFYPKDYESDEDVKMMSLEQEGAYLRLLCHAWLHGSVPAAVVAMAKICRVPTAKMARLWPGLKACFVEAGPDRLVNPRQEEERAGQERFRRERSESGRRGVAKRWRKEKAQPLNKDSSAIEQPIANDSTPYSVLRTAVTATAAHGPTNGATEVALGRMYLSREERARVIAEGERYLDAIVAASPGQDRGWVLRQHSTVKPSGAYLVALDRAKGDEHLTRTVHALRDTVEKLKGAESGERHGLLTAEEHERRRRG